MSEPVVIWYVGHRWGRWSVERMEGTRTPKQIRVKNTYGSGYTTYDPDKAFYSEEAAAEAAVERAEAKASGERTRLMTAEQELAEAHAYRNKRRSEGWQ